MGKIFGTDGARGVANLEITPKLAFDLGKAAAEVLKTSEKMPIFVVGKDTRISGDMLEAALTAGILSEGGNVIKAGVIPTPAVAYLVRHFKADAGVVISASHNTFEYNGIKLFNGEGFKLDDSIEEKIEKLVESGFEDKEIPVGENLGRCFDAEQNAKDLYVKFLLSKIDINLKGMRVVLDCANGAAYQVAPRVYEALGADVTVIGAEPDGSNINHDCGSTKPQQLENKVLEVGADIGLAFDGDADRLIVVDDRGREVNGDKTICICAKMLKDEGSLVDNRVTATVMSNLGFHKYLEKIGCKVDATKVGDRYVIESMLKTGSVLGGEQSGHIIFLNHTTTGDGTMSSLQVMKALYKDGRKMSKMADEIELFPQVLVNAKIKNEHKKDYMLDREVREMIQAIEDKMAGNGRVLIRPSGTEPLVRVMLEGKDVAVITRYAEDLAKLLEKKFQ
ncbi:MAG: phosphoglucosamine mutase [Clostridia bacterium]|nr:phosphoglucosamine mutase [Clostridia bacterium]